LIRNLAESSDQTSVTGTVSAGIAGLLLASRLRSHAMRVIVLESGHKAKPEATDALNAVIQLSQVYRGATDGRFRGLGGTSSKWGGQLIPMRPEDMAVAELFIQGNHKQDNDGYAASFCNIAARGNGPQREVIVLIATRTQNGPLERCAGVQGHAASPTAILLGHNLKLCGG
jgi:hypothetical protein